MAEVPRLARRWRDESHQPSRRRRPDRRRSTWRNASVAAILAVALLVAVLPQAPTSAAQDVPSDAAQQAAADKLLAQLDAIEGRVNPNKLIIDPALGPAPWISFLPGRNPATIDAWLELARRSGNTKPDENAARQFAVGVNDCLLYTSPSPRD